MSHLSIPARSQHSCNCSFDFLHDANVSDFLFFSTASNTLTLEEISALNGYGKSTLGLEKSNIEIAHINAVGEVKSLMNMGKYDEALTILQEDCADPAFKFRGESESHLHP